MARRLGNVGLGAWARHQGKAPMLGKAPRQDKARQGTEGQGKAGQGKARCLGGA
jgi:hypothetical protein